MKASKQRAVTKCDHLRFCEHPVENDCFIPLLEPDFYFRSTYRRHMFQPGFEQHLEGLLLGVFHCLPFVVTIVKTTA